MTPTVLMRECVVTDTPNALLHVLGEGHSPVWVGGGGVGGGGSKVVLC